MSRVQSQTARILIGAGLIIVGLLYFLREIDYIHIDLTDMLFSTPMVVFVIGLILLVNSRRKAIAIILISIGVVGFTLKAFNQDLSGFTIPVALLAIGFYIIYNHIEKQRENQLGVRDSSEPGGFNASAKDKIDEMAIFGGSKRILNSKNFQGGNITVLFGGMELFCRDCELADQDEVIIDLFVMFGGCDFVVPPHWNVKIDVVSLFGGFSSKKLDYKSVEVDDSKTLVIKGMVLFGGGEMKIF